MKFIMKEKKEGQKDNQAFVETTSSYPASIFTATDAIQHNSDGRNIKQTKLTSQRLLYDSVLWIQKVQLIATGRATTSSQNYALTCGGFVC
ncbi:MAG: hypothetical protein V8S89_03910 [Oscillospiraceae bacterium]